ncbi:MAG: protein translocase subunit SecF [Spirochaetaceae bacterium]|jgi:preprotein translocase subunit SecF|nr:protein translocase subunit SecF [Spirochaetaceae bacterium]
MKRVIHFSKGFFPAAIFSAVLIIAGVLAYVLLGGFNLGVDFQAGLIQEVQFAPTAFSLSYRGLGNASVSMDRNGLYLVLSGSGVEGVTYSFPYGEYPTIAALSSALRGAVEGLEVEESPGVGAAGSRTLLQSAQGNPRLSSDPYGIHYLPPGAAPIDIAEVRSSLISLGTVSVQVLGERAEERRFMIRIDDQDLNSTEGVPAEKIIAALEANFGAGGVAVTRSDYVGARFSKQLTDQAGLLMGLTLLLILIYSSIRFKPQFAVGAVLAIAHDALIMVAFVTWTRMEFNTTTIAAILTILGYSINDTIVIFDRIRETRRIYPDDRFVDILDRSLSETLGRTMITTLTTMLAVLALFVFTTKALYSGDVPLSTMIRAIFTEHNSMKDFALALLVGMVSGVYSTIYIASGFTQFWEHMARKRAAKSRTVKAVPAKA